MTETTMPMHDQFQPEYTSRLQTGTASRTVSIFYIAFQVLLFAVCVAITVIGIIKAPEMMSSSVQALLIYPLMLAVFLWFVLTEPWTLYLTCTSYRIESDGLWQKRPFHAERCLPWTDFRQVCVCPMKKSLCPGIFCVMHTARPFPHEMHPPAYSSFPFSRRGVIYLTYSPELVAGFQERCPLPVEKLA